MERAIQKSGANTDPGKMESSDTTSGNDLLGPDKSGRKNSLLPSALSETVTPEIGAQASRGLDTLGKVKSPEQRLGEVGANSSDLSQHVGASGNSSSFNTWLDENKNGISDGMRTQFPGSDMGNATKDSSGRSNHLPGDPKWARQSASDLSTSDWAQLHHNLSGSYDYPDTWWSWGGGGDFNNSNHTLSPLNVTTVEPMPYPYLSGYSLPHVIVTSIFVTMLMIIIVFGNALVIIAIARDRHLKAIQNWFIASLAVSDLFVGLLIMPLSLANELIGYWVFGQILCELWLATDVLLCTASILNLCLISLDRYWSITRAVSYVKQRTKKRAMIMITLVWLLSMIICFPPLVGWKRPQSTTKWGHPLCTLTDDIGYVIYSTLGSFYLPLIVMVVVYFKIYVAARSRARRGLKPAKPKPAAVTSKKPTDNGKSPNAVPNTVTTTTTTSFSTPIKIPADNKVCSKEFDSLEEEPEPSPSLMPEATMATSTVTSSEPENTANNGQVAVPMTTLHSIDEKRKLLASELEDTDSACESTPRHEIQLRGKARLAHTMDETDSTSDTPCSRPTRSSLKGKCYNEENMKPLLEDSQLESDCDTVKGLNIKQNTTNNQNNNVGGGDKEGDETEGEHNQITADDELKEAIIAKIENQTETDDHHEFAGESHDLQNKPKKKHILLSPSTFRRISMHVRKTHITTKKEHTKSSQLVEDADSRKRRIARARERRANLVLGIVMGTFILCWLPFFSTYVIASLTGLEVPPMVFAVFFWAGYCNSALNPVIYTIFNREFKQAFQRLLFCSNKRRNARIK